MTGTAIAFGDRDIYSVGGLMKKLLTAIAAALPITAAAVPLTMEYSINAIGGGQYRYDFKLTLDNNDNSWTPGNQFDWIVFGDRQGSLSADSGFCPTSAFCTFSEVVAATSGLDANWSATSSSGGHQGPTLMYGGSPTLPGWAPQLGDFIDWSYTSSLHLPDGQLYFGLVMNGSSYFLAREVGAAVPEPASLALLGLGLAGLALRRRRQ